MRVDATLTGNYGFMILNLIIGNVTEACSQAGVFEIWYSQAYEYITGHEFEEPSDVINTYEEVDGVCRAVSHFSEYTPVCNSYYHYDKKLSFLLIFNK